MSKLHLQDHSPNNRSDVGVGVVVVECFEHSVRCRNNFHGDDGSEETDSLKITSCTYLHEFRRRLASLVSKTYKRKHIS